MRRTLKMLAVALAGVVIAVAVIFVLGGRPRTYSARVAIAAPPEEVFGYLTQPELLKLWISGLTASEPLTNDGVRPGARSREIVVENGRRVEMESEILEVTPGRSLSVRLTGEGMVVVADYALGSEGGKTLVTLTQVARYGGAFRLAAPFLDGLVERQLASNFETLRVHAERRAP